MMNMQFAGMIQPHGFNVGGYNTGQQNEGLAAKALSTSSAVGAPGAMLGLGLLGLDPISMGVRTGMAASGAGVGMGGAAMAGAVAGGGMALGLGAIGYMGNQVMQGMQQGQQFNNAMRSGYSFFNPSGNHGRGFSEGGIREIGSSMRGMAGEGGFTELGPSFNELGRMASNMGRMGLADGVRNAKEFTEKFREMMKSVKTIAEDMGTTLEEAQKMMASMKGSGIFKNQSQVGSAIRSASVAGGLATTEVTGMMNVGSQISRMFGGTGRQGAMGGIRAIEQVGTAVQTGVLNEEDIYQSTGLYGAEGRQALAQQQMMQTGSFLKSSKGRWLLASLAGKDGTLDRSSVNDFLTGGMSVGGTRQAAHRNLNRIGGGGGYRSGRADFIRNEGRLRGAVMEEFGGLAPAMAMMGWAQGKGIDIHSMGDREMLFMQRHLGMGRDEMDSMMKMVRKMPEMLQHRRESQQADAGVREHGIRAQNSGIEGVKRKLEAARNKVNNEMQRVGQDILNNATDMIASWGNRLAGTYEEHIIGGVREAQRAAMMGGSTGRDASRALLGGGSLKAMGGFGGPRENFSQRRYIDKMDDLQFSARLGSAGGMGDEMSALVKSQSSSLKKAYADELSGLGGEDRMAAFKRHFGKDTEMGRRFRAMSERERATFMQQMEGEIGIKSGRLSETFQKVDFGAGAPGLAQMVGGGRYRTEQERTEAMGSEILGLGGMENDYDPITGRVRRQKQRALTGDEKKRAAAAGRMLDDPEMRKLALDSLTGAAGADDRMNSAIANLKGLGAERGGMDKLTAEEAGKLGALQSIQTAGEIERIANKRGGHEKLTEADWKSLVAKRKAQVAAQGGDPSSVTKEGLQAQANKVRGMAGAQQEAVVRQLAGQVGRDSRQEQQLMRAGGIAKYTKSGGAEVLTLTDETRASLLRSGGQGAVQAAEMALEVQSLGAAAGNATTVEAQRAILGQMHEKGGALFDQMAGMDVKSLRAFGASMAGTQVGGMASELIMRGQAIEGGKRKGGAAGAIAAQLGLQLSAEDIAGLRGKDAAGGAAAIAARLGVGGDEAFTKGLEEAIAASAKKGGGIQGGALLQRALEGAQGETKKKLEEMARGQQSPDEKIIDKIGESNKYLAEMAKKAGVSEAILRQISGNTQGSADGEAGGGGRRGG